METDITAYAAGYVLIHVAVLSALGYGVFRVLASTPRRWAAKNPA